MKAFLNATLLVGIFILTQLTLADTPPIPESPEEDFAYLCEFSISHQVRANDKSCYANFEATKVLNKSDGKENWYNDINIYPKDLDLKLSYSDPECETQTELLKKPYINTDNTFMSLMVSKHRGGTYAGEYVARVHVRVASPEHKLLTSSSHNNFPFSLGKFEGWASLTTESFSITHIVKCSIQ